LHELSFGGYDALDQNLVGRDRIPAGTIKLNRYTNILPNPRTRVRLDERDQDERTRYINANFIQGFDGTPRRYIATQGPMPETVVAFWRMLWEKDVRAVVMVTGLREKGVEKCARYWPTALYNEAEQCGDVQFGEVNVAILAGYRKEGFITSKFRVRCDGAEREVWHFWYDSWPDHGVPTKTAPAVAMLKAVREFNDNIEQPWVVHCSAGIGRTGSFIGVDHGIRQFETGKSVKVEDIIKAMRGDRGGMVQHYEQAEWVQKVLQQHLDTHSPQVPGGTVLRQAVRKAAVSSAAAQFAVHPSQLDGDEGSETTVPSWRQAQLAAVAAEAEAERQAAIAEEADERAAQGLPPLSRADLRKLAKHQQALERQRSAELLVPSGGGVAGAGAGAGAASEEGEGAGEDQLGDFLSNVVATLKVGQRRVSISASLPEGGGSGGGGGPRLSATGESEGALDDGGSAAVSDAEDLSDWSSEYDDGDNVPLRGPPDERKGSDFRKTNWHSNSKLSDWDLNGKQYRPSVGYDPADTLHRRADGTLERGRSARPGATLQRDGGGGGGSAGVATLRRESGEGAARRAPPLAAATAATATARALRMVIGATVLAVGVHHSFTSAASYPLLASSGDQFEGKPMRDFAGCVLTSAAAQLVGLAAGMKIGTAAGPPSPQPAAATAVANGWFVLVAAVGLLFGAVFWLAALKFELVYVSRAATGVAVGAVVGYCGLVHSRPPGGWRQLGGSGGGGSSSSGSGSGGRRVALPAWFSQLSVVWVAASCCGPLAALLFDPLRSMELGDGVRIKHTLPAVFGAVSAVALLIVQASRGWVGSGSDGGDSGKVEASRASKNKKGGAVAAVDGSRGHVQQPARTVEVVLAAVAVFAAQLAVGVLDLSMPPIIIGHYGVDQSNFYCIAATLGLPLALPALVLRRCACSRGSVAALTVGCAAVALGGALAQLTDEASIYITGCFLISTGASAVTYSIWASCVASRQRQRVRVVAVAAVVARLVGVVLGVVACDGSDGCSPAGSVAYVLVAVAAVLLAAAAAFVGAMWADGGRRSGAEAFTSVQLGGGESRKIKNSLHGLQLRPSQLGPAASPLAEGPASGGTPLVIPKPTKGGGGAFCEEQPPDADSSGESVNRTKTFKRDRAGSTTSIISSV
jgi:receptor-type tyrosine-protein phosphatase R